jgi:hypothetical protein
MMCGRSRDRCFGTVTLPLCHCGLSRREPIERKTVPNGSFRCIGDSSMLAVGDLCCVSQHAEITDDVNEIC